MLMNFDVGLSFLYDEFGYRPSIGWQIDPFGQSKVHAAILAKLGYDGLITNRVSNSVKEQMKNRYGYTFEWHGHDVFWNSSTKILCHYLESFYTVPTVRLDQ